jgi:hypothetical protein
MRRQNPDFWGVARLIGSHLRAFDHPITIVTSRLIHPGIFIPVCERPDPAFLRKFYAASRLCC